MGASVRVAAAPESPAPVSPRIAIAILIDQGTGSSASQLARAMQAFGFAALYGAPAADNPAGLGEIAFFRMPHTRLIFAAPSAMFLDVAGNGADGPVMPDILICDADRQHFAPEFGDEAAAGADGAWTIRAAPAFGSDLDEADYCATAQ